MRVTRRLLHEERAAPRPISGRQVQQRHVQRAPTKVKHKHLLGFLGLLQVVGHRSGHGFLHQPSHLEASQQRCLLRGPPLLHVELGWYGDGSGGEREAQQLLHAQGGLCRLLEPPQHKCAQLLWCPLACGGL
mmetsp:Transcript_13210/g.48134  ORF Transcript_13210/g.48134 Transcript_13210/m.48134 type:complete len:132 (-) Transcript_13210:741-1136(-)